MKNAADQIQDEFRSRVAAAVKEGLDLVANLMETKEYIAGYFSWPKMSLSKYGLPQFSEAYFLEGPTDYSRAFIDFRPLKQANTIKSFRDLFDHHNSRCYLF